MTDDIDLEKLQQLHGRITPCDASARLGGLLLGCATATDAEQRDRLLGELAEHARAVSEKTPEFVFATAVQAELVKRK